jgi:hypothetical protein
MRLALLFALAAAAIATAAVVIATRDDEPESAATPPTAPQPAPAADALTEKPGRGVRETCATRSEADFGKPFQDPGNLVAGPFVLVGGAKFTTPSVVRSVKGQKYPVLVRAGHEVTLVVPEEARTLAGLGYGPLPQGEITLVEAHKQVTFVACPAAEPSYSMPGETIGPTTFWSGFVVAHEPHCVPLDVWVDDEPTPRRIVVELGVKPCSNPEAQV